MTRHSAPDWGFFFGDDAYTFTANGNIEVLAVEAGTKAKMLRFIHSPPMKLCELSPNRALLRSNVSEVTSFLNSIPGV